MSEFKSVPNAAHAFEQSKGASHPGKLESVNDAARAELDNRYNHEQEHDAHLRAWEAEMRRLSRSADPYPDFDLGARGHRNLVRDYDETLSISNMRAIQIDQRFETRRDEIRDIGQTLSNAFETQAQANEPSLEPRASPYLTQVHERSRGIRR